LGFFVIATVAILALQSAHGFFPGDRAGAFLGRLLCSLAAVALMVAGGRWLLARDGLAGDRLALGFGAGSARAFLLGAALAVAHILLLMAALFAVTPFELGRGPSTGPSVAVAGMGYLAGNSVEELLFRGYLLVVLARWLGTTRAIWIMAAPFGLFHFQGLDALALLKMMLTTGAMHFGYAYVFLATRSLWAAIAMHALGNTLLHAVLGVEAPGLLSVTFTRDLPAAVDAPFLVFFTVTAAMAVLLSQLPATRRGAAWLAFTPGAKP
jgi:membrane protease YdiL (CAAX protease family)